MKNTIIESIIIINLILSPFCWGKYSGGTGEPNDPYLIATAEDLNSIGLDPNDWDKHFLMTADINMTGHLEYNIICGESSGGWYAEFQGVFDGNEHTVSNLEIDAGRSMAGLFGYIGIGGVIKNIFLQTISVKGIHYVGGVAGRNEGKILNCHVSGMIEGDQACGGITGYCCSTQAEIRECSFRGQVHGTYSTGGIVGGTDSPEISGCYAFADINGVSQCGGIVGHNTGGNLNRCFVKGSVTCAQCSGGFVGITYDHCGFGGEIRDCYADVIVHCSNEAGGFSGSVPGDGEIRNCYCYGRVVYDENNYTDIGAFIGEDRIPHGVFSSYFLDTAGPDNGFGEPLSSMQMQMRAIFADAGWDMVNVWDIGENQTYPFLRAHLPSDINKDGETNLYDLAILALNWLEEY